VQRSGVVKDAELRCGYRFTFDNGVVRAKGHKCGGPVGTWTLEDRYTLSGVEIRTAKILEIGPDYRGTWRVDATATGYGGAASAGNSGTAQFDPGPPATLSISGRGGTMKFLLESNPPECAGK
jgi:hypothetical protein